MGSGHRGGEGLVFRARYQGRLPRPVFFAVKQLVAPPGTSPGAWPEEWLVQRWREQLKLLHLVRHDHLVGYRELVSGWPPHPEGTCGGEPPAELRTWYLVMEWVEGPSLHDLVRAGRTGITERVRYVAQLADAVEYLHSGADTAGMTLLHRDIKPGNVIVNAERGAVLVDYGLLRVEEPTLTELPAWTGPYLAPEVHADKTRTSRASDMWAVAATAFFALSGEQPSPFDPGLMRRQLNDQLTTEVADTDRVVAIVMGVLDRPPDERPRSPTAWASRLAREVNRVSVPAPSSPVSTGISVGPTNTDGSVPGSAPADSLKRPRSASLRRGSRGFRVGVALVVLAMVAAGVAAGLWLTGQFASSPHTQQVGLQPFDTNAPLTSEQGPGPGVTIGSQTVGIQCAASLADTMRRNAYVCEVAQPDGVGYQDPCFLGSHETTYVLCFTSPSDRGATKVKLLNSLAPNPTNPKGDPWALQLTNGQLCVTKGKGNSVVDGLTNNYQCPNLGQLYGDPDRSTAAWTIFYQAPGSSDLMKVDILKSYS